VLVAATSRRLHRHQQRSAASASGGDDDFEDGIRRRRTPGQGKKVLHFWQQQRPSNVDFLTILLLLWLLLSGFGDVAVVLVHRDDVVMRPLVPANLRPRHRRHFVVSSWG